MLTVAITAWRNQNSRMTDNSPDFLGTQWCNNPLTKRIHYFWFWGKDKKQQDEATKQTAKSTKGQRYMKRENLNSILFLLDAALFLRFTSNGTALGALLTLSLFPLLSSYFVSIWMENLGRKEHWREGKVRNKQHVSFSVNNCIA